VCSSDICSLRCSRSCAGSRSGRIAPTFFRGSFRQTLGDGLPNAGFQAAAPAFFSSLGDHLSHALSVHSDAAIRPLDAARQPWRSLKTRDAAAPSRTA
jgi:hypothetical protein